MKFNWKKYVIIIELAGWTDKGKDGHRADSYPILNAIKSKWFDWEIIFYDHNKQDKLFEELKEKAGVIIWRINPGNCKYVDEYFQFLNRLSNEWIFINTDPNVMINLDFKDMLVKLSNCSYSDKDSVFYTDYEKFKVDFKNTLLEKKFRILKQNYGSTGEWVWLVKLEDNWKVITTEAVNNEKFEFENIDIFISDFEKYFEKDAYNAVFFKEKTWFVDVRFLPRISEWEVRVVLIWEKPALVIHKKPQEWKFSATLFSWAKYKSDTLEDPKWKEIISLVNENMWEVKKYLNWRNFPLLWTLDFILDYNENKTDKYVLSEINCSCVGITTDLHLSYKIADELIKMLEL